jgi:hypothetical protein
MWLGVSRREPPEFSVLYLGRMALMESLGCVKGCSISWAWKWDCSNAREIVNSFERSMSGSPFEVRKQVRKLKTKLIVLI